MSNKERYYEAYNLTIVLFFLIAVMRSKKFETNYKSLTTYLTKMTTNFNDLPLNVLGKIMREKVDIETRDMEGFASRFEVVKVTKKPDMRLCSRDYIVNYVFKYKPTQKFIVGRYTTWDKNDTFTIESVLELLRERCEECELGDYQNIDIYKESIGVYDDEDIEYEDYVYCWNKAILMKKVLGITDYNIFVRIGSPFANWTFRRVD